MQTQTKPMKEVMQEKWKKRPLIISGPCSAETEDQVLETATRLAKTGKVDILRAGIWKPRTKPGMFEGIGMKGLPWMAQAKKITGLPITVEVATAKHVEDAYILTLICFGSAREQLSIHLVSRKFATRFGALIFLC